MQWIGIKPLSTYLDTVKFFIPSDVSKVTVSDPCGLIRLVVRSNAMYEQTAILKPTLHFDFTWSSIVCAIH
ncbi:hypothetical protein YTPLAS21_06320 [Candidatus Nitrosocosmicus sp.]|nr:hypothetical protein YTPLAS21_06320 [Candidatus Nitrosocosmicus sp.]